MINKSYHIVNAVTFFTYDRISYAPQLDEYLRQLAPSMTQWRRDFHLHAESGWLEFRTSSKVADILDGLGYQLALGRDVIDADSRMGLPDEETLARAFERAREQGRAGALAAGV